MKCCKMPWGLFVFLILVIAARLNFRFEFSNFEIALISLIVLILLKKDLGDLFEEIKFGGVELKTRIQKIEKDQRLYAIVGPSNQIIHSTFRAQEFELVEFDPVELKVKFKLNPKPNYLEVRSNQGATFAIEFNDGVYSCEANGFTSSGQNKVIVEAYFKSQPEGAS